ncbi:ribulose bisphosphate carboxylase small subunit [Microcoleus sp. FACHB-SPT15]|uniref:ribulose bisphosphate carboxylase small subunit n=1 Tax=Microcoleus sp. FACHB-SPT15 TaxID=2692830 RepID=UPI001784EF80|nr:ribulose bisphosphate carboxylase small subunit [Microcoleus sp. FACHB-SPT15]MBD1807767.1 ribulose bisphosphate carboxylase small subunit [Microcoleus sp. FACHB-SPT15]
MSYYISPRFLDKLAVHITKNYLDLPGVRVPLILGIHGRKGEGKSFQCELVFERMGVEAVHMSAGELESPDAGDPSRLIRLRYREAAELIKVRGKMAVLMINDLDAGAGRFDQGTQYTVNTQLVNGTLMNIADNPTDVQLPGSYDSTPLPRVPIIVTGNDFSTLYAPLIRDGRMEKFFWEPNREDKIGVVEGIFSEDGLPRREIEQLVETFSNQAIDFFSALRSRVYDEQIREFIHKIGIDRVSSRIVNSAEEPPKFPKPNFQLPRLIEFGNLLTGEQKQIEDMRLVREYNQGLGLRVTPQEPRGSSRPAPTKPENGNAIASNNLGDESTSTSASNGFSDSSNSSKQVPSIPLDLETQEQIRELLAQGYRLSIEYANERRVRTNAWQSGTSFQGNEASEAIITLAESLGEHRGEYVRLIGIDTKAKRRVLEKIIQRPHD